MKRQLALVLLGRCAGLLGLLDHKAHQVLQAIQGHQARQALLVNRVLRVSKGRLVLLVHEEIEEIDATVVQEVTGMASSNHPLNRLQVAMVPPLLPRLQ